MKTHFLFCVVLITVVVGRVRAQEKGGESKRAYEDISYRNDSSHLQSTLRVGGSFAAQYNSSLDAPISIGSEVNGVLTGSIYQYGSNGDNADFNMFPEAGLIVDGLLFEHLRYRLQLDYDGYGFGWSDGLPLNNTFSIPYYRNSTEALACKVSAGFQGGGAYFLFGAGYGDYLYGAHGIGVSPDPATPKNEVASTLFTWGFTAGEDFPLTDHKLYFSPEIYYSNNGPTNHPLVDFIPNTFSLGIRLNLEWVLFEHYQQIEEKKEFLYAEGHVRDCKTSQPLAAQISAVDRQSNEVLETHSSDSGGRYEFRLATGKDYLFTIHKPGYFPDSVSLLPNSQRDCELPVVSLRNQTAGCAEDSSYRIEGNISACDTRKPVDATIRIIDSSSNFVAAEVRTDSSGNYHANIEREGDYFIQVDAPGYFPSDETVNLSHVDSKKNIPIRVNDILVCDSVNMQSYFDFDRYNLTADATPYVDRIAEYLKNNPTIRVAIEGHTDSMGLRSHNMMLSRNRANTLKSYLMAKGVLEKQIVSVTGFGPDQPIADNQTEEGRQKNRRVDLKQVNRKEH
jgi:outer membrane protein OmpA-like peptidoglycan-associated protein